MSEYKITIGLEVHVALKTDSKLFSRSACDFDAQEFSYFDAGIPGMLPVLSEKPVEMALKFAVAVNAEIPPVSYFERKHYFYPDLALGYQITQQHRPIMIGGIVPIELDGKKINVQIEHAHLECDAAKSLHDRFPDYTAIDLSRGSSPLLEIVSTPCLHSPREAKIYAQTVCEMVKYLGICDGKLEEGSFRVDASISLSKTDVLGTRVEIKNISSFGFLQAALEYEIERQTELLDSGQLIDMETRLFDESTTTTHSMRKKETVHEYRYMPDPDIPAIVLDQDMLKAIREDKHIYYFEVRQQFVEFFEKFEVKIESVPALLEGEYRDIWLAMLDDESMQSERFIRMLAFWLPEAFARIEGEKRSIDVETIKFLVGSKLEAKEVKETVIRWATSSADIQNCLPELMSDDDLKSIILETFAEFTQQVEQYKSGQEKVLQFIIGKIMAKTKGKAPATLVRERATELIKSV
jgi:aspartyl-tRNA(Asn)/glutamyl-tRNA(Gln) amidotransferase subunit B